MAKSGYSSAVGSKTKNKVRSTPSGTGVTSRARPKRSLNSAGSPLKGKNLGGYPSIKSPKRPIG